MMMVVLHMSCTSPLYAWPYTLKGDPKIQYKITGLREKAYFKPYEIPVPSEPKLIPCGKCASCRLRYSRQWADRCMLEAKYHPFNWFLTLTYDDDHVPTVAVFDDDDSVVCHYSLIKRDLQLFFKRLREKFGYESFRYYACGEYGSSTFRPHYHVCLFSEISDEFLNLMPISYKRGNWLYTSDVIDSVWKNGMIGIAPLSWETCAYTARYCMKKLGGAAADDYKILGLEPEFSIMSRRPGIGNKFYEENKHSIYEFSSFSIETEKGSRKMRPSSYYDRLYDLEFPDEMKKIKSKRAESSKIALKLKLERTDLCFEDYLKVEEMSVNDRLKKLVREEI